MSGNEPSILMPRAIDEAAQWFLRLQQETENGQTFIDWQKWLSAAPENRQAYEQIEDTALRLRMVPETAVKLPEPDEMARDDYDGSRPIQEWKSTRKPSRFKMRYAMAASLAGLIALSTGFWLSRSAAPLSDSLSYRTTAGERQTIELTDGSKVTLDADSALDVRFDSGRRLLRLARGEAYFQVARDPQRPFQVDTGATQVTALGTAFNIRLSENRTIVAVTEGKVEVTAAPTPTSGTAGTVRMAAQVSAGEAVAYSDNGNLHALPKREVSLATGWLEGRRQYRNEPLRYVLADVDRYTGRHIEIADEATGELKFTGTLNLQNSAAWLQGLSVALPVSVTQKEDGTLSVRMALP